MLKPMKNGGKYFVRVQNVGYKERCDVEYAFDTLQNTLGAEPTWMRSRESLQGYLFIIFIALHLYSQVLEHLKTQRLTDEV